MVSLPKNIIASLFKSNLAVKLLCLALAISVWGFIAASRECRRELVLPVEFSNIPPGYIPNTHNQTEVSFTLSGPAVRMRAAGKNNSKIVLDLRGAATPGKTLFTSLEKYLYLHESVQVIRTSPASLEIALSAKPNYPSQGDQNK